MLACMLKRRDGNNHPVPNAWWSRVRGPRAPSRAE
jgi:hypothetical protein